MKYTTNLVAGMVYQSNHLYSGAIQTIFELFSENPTGVLDPIANVIRVWYKNNVELGFWQHHVLLSDILFFISEYQMRIKLIL